MSDRMMIQMLSYVIVFVIGIALGIVIGNDNLRHKARTWLRTHLRQDSEGKTGKLSKEEKARRVKLDDYD